jgi:ubiquitin C-terminal hydrolase
MSDSSQEEKKLVEVTKLPDPRHKGVVGLQNMGNTCYANSSIQLLRAVPEWNAFILREDLSSAIIADSLHF